MKFKELFDKEILNEQHVRKELKVIYELNLDLYKPEEIKVPQEQPQQNNTQEIQQVPQEMPQVPVQQTPEVSQEQPENVAPDNQQQPQQNNADLENNKSLDIALSSVVTEDEISSNSENRIIRKFEGEIKLSDSQKDNIQSFEDIIEVLSNYKKDGTNILDEFCSEVIGLCSNQQFDQIKQKVDKKSKIWVEIYYGYNKDDSVGVRFNKRQNSDILTSTLLIDNEIVSAKFSIDKVNQRISEYRNYDAKKS
mgnify:CR=1 FL=1